MEFIFQISVYNRLELEQQLAQALDKRTEIISRKRLPRIWKGIDWIRSRPKATEQVSKRRVVLYKIYGLVLLAMGVFVLVPGLMAPQQAILIIAGILSIGLGIIYLFPRRKKENKQFQRAAVKLLSGFEGLAISEESPIRVSFAETGMTIGENDAMPYSRFNAAVETEDLYLLTYNEQVTVLQKRDLMTGTHPDFVRSLKEQTGLSFAQIP